MDDLKDLGVCQKSLGIHRLRFHILSYKLLHILSSTSVNVSTFVSFLFSGIVCQPSDLINFLEIFV